MQQMIDLAVTQEDVEEIKETYLSLAIQGILTSNDAKPNLSWPRMEFRNLAEFKAGRTPARQEHRYWKPEDIPWVSIADLVNDGVVELTKEKISKAASEEVFKSPPAPAGTLLMSFKLTIGKISTLGVPAYFNEAIISIEPSPLVSKEYLILALPNIARGGDSRNAIKGKTLNRESLGRLVVPVPPLDEQKKIVVLVREFFGKLDNFGESLVKKDEARRNALKGLAHKLSADIASQVGSSIEDAED